MDPNRLTRGSRRALAAARMMAIDRGCAQVDTSHLQDVLLSHGGAARPEAVGRLGIEPCALRVEPLARLAERACGPDALRLPGQVFLTQGLLRVLDAAENKARLARRERVSVQHLRKALLEQGRRDTGPSCGPEGSLGPTAGDPITD